MNLSFAGCGFLGIYHVGVASCFREYAPHVLVDKIAGASVGSIAACALICNVSLGDTTTNILKIAVKARSRALGPMHPGFDLNKLIKDGLENALPENAHIMCSGRLFISVTRFSDGKNVMLSQFDSREDLIQAILCSCFIPAYSGFVIPTFHGMACFDGGFSDNLPVLDENTVTVSPFAGEHDICPQDDSCNILQINLANTHIAISARNIYRFFRILFPPHPEILSKMCQHGFDDALKFLQRNKRITCARCMAVQSCLTCSETDGTDTDGSVSDSDHEHTLDCLDCRYRRQTALLDSLPESVIKAIQDACDQVNKGVINWLFRHRPVKLLSFLGLPYVLPIDISIVIFCKIWQMMPTLQKELHAKFKSILALIRSLLKKIDNSKHLCYAKFSCQMAITEFDYTEENITSPYDSPNPSSAPTESYKVTAKHEVSVPVETLAMLPEAPPQGSQRDSSSRPSQRKSYAGFTSASYSPPQNAQRRMSMVEMHQPERVVRNMKFNFTLDLAPTVGTNNKKQDVIQALKSLGEDNDDSSIIELTNQALNWERECINNCQGDLEPENAETLGKILDCTSNEAFMAYYYFEDGDKTLKVTEIYNVDDADTSAVLSDGEREANQNLQFEESDWISSAHLDHDEPPSAITDTFDDREFDMSDAESEMSEDSDIFKQLKRDTEQVSENIRTVPPRRKMSFIVVNK